MTKEVRILRDALEKMATGKTDGGFPLSVFDYQERSKNSLEQADEIIN